MTSNKSIKSDVLIFLISLIIISVSITSYLGVSYILTSGKNAEQTTALALKSQTQKFLVQLTTLSAEKNDNMLENVRKDASNAAAFAANIFDNPEIFAREAYWKFDKHVFIGEHGQYMNGMDDISSLFIPNHVVINGDLKRRVELSAYLDQVFPKVLENDPNIVAIWIVGLEGESQSYSRYYPNIGLGNIAFPDERTAEQIFVTVANPKNNPERKVVWTPVYDDPAGQGLMITASAPVYTKEGFLGVLGIDVTLATTVKNIEEYNPIESSYAFLIGKDGYSIAFPEQAYKDILGRARQEGEYRTDLNNVTNEFSPVLGKMKEGFTGFESVRLGDKELYVVYAPLKGAGFSLGVVVEEEVMLKAVSDMQKEMKESTQKMIYSRVLPMGIAILIIAVILGFLMINRVIEPIKKLTTAAEELSKGNLDVKADITVNNEIGQLASTFNKMIDDLKKSRRELEEHGKTLDKQVAERTKELQSKMEELEKFSKVSVDRELKMIELKKRIKELESETRNKKA